MLARFNVEGQRKQSVHCRVGINASRERKHGHHFAKKEAANGEESFQIRDNCTRGRSQVHTMTLVDRCFCFVSCFLAVSVAFQPALPSGCSQRRKNVPMCFISDCGSSTTPKNSRLSASLEQTEESETLETTQVLYNGRDSLNDGIHRLCRAGEMEAALELIRTAEETEGSPKANQPAYSAIMNAYARSGRDDAAERAEEIMASMSDDGCEPKGQAYNAVILAWSNSRRPDAAERADWLLSKLWSLYTSTEDQAYLPTRATYTAVITTWARSNQSKKAAERAEELLEEMEKLYRDGHTLLGPTTACVNAVL